MIIVTGVVCTIYTALVSIQTDVVDENHTETEQNKHKRTRKIFKLNSKLKKTKQQQQQQQSYLITYYIPIAMILGGP